MKFIKRNSILALILSISFSFLFSSCKKDDENENPTNQASYFPLTGGSTWSYQDETNQTYIHTLSSQTKNIGGFSWNIITVTPNVADEDILVRLDASSQIVYRAIDFTDGGGILIIEPIADLDAKVGDTWTQNNEQDGVFLNLKNTLLEKDVQKTVNGKSYDKVMVVKSELTSNFFDNSTSTLYFAAGIGLVAEEFEDGDYTRLVDYSIK